MSIIPRFSAALTAAMALPAEPPPASPPKPSPPKPPPLPPASADWLFGETVTWAAAGGIFSDLQWGPDDPFEMPEPQKTAPPNRAARRKQAKNRR